MKKGGRALIGALAVTLLLQGCTVNSAKNRYLFAEKLWKDGKYAAAVSEFEKVIAKDSKGRLGQQAMYRAAMTQTLYLEQHGEAVRKFKAFAELSPEAPLAWDAQKQIGEIYFFRTEQYDPAIRHYRSLIQQRPNAPELPEFLYRIGKSEFFLWRFDDALKTFREIQSRFPEQEWAEKAAFEIGVTYYTRGERRPAGTRVSSQESYQDAMDAYQGFLKKYPRSPLAVQAQFGIAACLEELDQLDAAYHRYEALQSTYPSPKVIQIKLARIRERKIQRNR